MDTSVSTGLPRSVAEGSSPVAGPSTSQRPVNPPAPPPAAAGRHLGTPPPTATTSANDHQQLRRNNDRLRARSERAEGEIRELRDANRDAREEVARGNAILELMMGWANLDPAIFARLEDLSDVLDGVAEKLRKAG
jgi:hypothetical protein